MDTQTDAACTYYDTHYDVIFEYMWQRSKKRMLNGRTGRHCRFCGKSQPDVTFRTVAHVIPEALGNRGLTSTYECDECNQHFGRTIENHLGEWSKPMRTFARIRGKKGVPTIKKGPSDAWRIECKNNRLSVNSYEDDPIFDIDEKTKKITFTLQRGTYIPVAVLKAFVKIGLTLISESELSAFQQTLTWIREADHSKSWVSQAIIIHTFQNGPMPPDRLVAYVLRRKAGINNVPYAYLILGFGNDVYQVMLPAPSEDAALNGEKLSLIPFPTPGGLDPAKYGRAMPKQLNMTGAVPVKGETTQIRLGYDECVSKGPESS